MTNEKVIEEAQLSSKIPPALLFLPLLPETYLKLQLHKIKLKL